MQTIIRSICRKTAWEREKFMSKGRSPAPISANPSLVKLLPPANGWWVCQSVCMFTGGGGEVTIYWSVSWLTPIISSPVQIYLNNTRANSQADQCFFVSRWYVKANIWKPPYRAPAPPCVRLWPTSYIGPCLPPPHSGMFKFVILKKMTKVFVNNRSNSSVSIFICTKSFLEKKWLICTKSLLKKKL